MLTILKIFSQVGAGNIINGKEVL